VIYQRQDARVARRGHHSQRFCCIHSQRLFAKHRFPTFKRFRDAYWNPDDPRIFTDRVVGIGWAVNFGRLIPRLRDGYRRLAERA